MSDQEMFGLGSTATDSSLVPRAILEISETVNGTNNLDELYTKVHQIISHHIPADNFYIALYNSDTKEITYPYYVDQLEVISSKDERIHKVDDVTSYALNQSNPLLITSKMLNELVKTGKISDQEKFFSEWLGVPLITNDKKTIGVLALQSRDNELVFSESHKSFLKFISHEIAGAIQYKRYEEELKQREKKFRTLYMKNPLMYFIIDQDGIVIDANERIKVDLGYEAKELIGKDVRSVFHPDDVTKVDQNLKECIQHQEFTHKWEIRKISKSGEIVWVRESASTLSLPGEKFSILIACENITDYKKAEIQLRESEEKYRLLTEHIDEMILLHDKTGKILFVNEAGLTLCERDSNELIGLNAYLLFDEDYKDKVIEYLYDDSKRNSLFLYNVQLSCKSKSHIPVEINATKLKKRDEEEKLLVVARDTRDRIQGEESVRSYNEELKKSNYAKDKFFSIIAHDLRSPFNALLSYAEILLDEFPELERDEIKEYVTHMHNVSNNIYELLNNLLDWSRIQTNKFYIDAELFDLESVIKKVVGIFSEVAKSKNIKILLECDDKCNVYADENMISTVLRNLISNAVKFSDENSFIKIKAKSYQDYLSVVVEDNGIGMLHEDIEKLFRIDINHTTLGTRQEKGTGLGLILAKEMIEKNNGSISVKSSLGKGSVFEFTVPTHP